MTQKRIGGWAIVAGILMLALPAKAQIVTNGDFETGNLSPWNVFTTDNGGIGAGPPLDPPDVVMFETVEGDTSNAARLRAIRLAGAGASPAGGGIAQMVTTPAGMLTVSLDVAQMAPEGQETTGAIFNIFFDNVLVDTIDQSQPISGGDTIRGSAERAILDVEAGMHMLGIEAVTTLDVTAANVPLQFIDNVSLVPEPAFASLSAAATGTLATLVATRRARASDPYFRC